MLGHTDREVGPQSRMASVRSRMGRPEKKFLDGLQFFEERCQKRRRKLQNSVIHRKGYLGEPSPGRKVIDLQQVEMTAEVDAPSVPPRGPKKLEKRRSRDEI